MKNYGPNKQVLFFVLLLVTSPLPASDYFCWDNDDGVRECGNYVPAQYSQKGFLKRGENGVWKQVKPAPTQEEIVELERQKEEERKRQQQEEEDKALLKLFSSEQEIELAYEADLVTIDGRIKSIETILEELQGNLQAIEENFEYNKKAASLSESQMNAIKTNIEGVKTRIRDTEATLQDKRLERDKIDKRYDTIKKKYQDIMYRQSNVQSVDGNSVEYAQ